jgi:hypothetical protein
MSVIGLVVVAAVLLLLGLCASRGWAVDSRDQRFSAGRLAEGHDDEVLR